MKNLVWFFAALVLLARPAVAGDTCNGCDKLKVIETQFRAVKKPIDYYMDLQLKATDVIAKMPSKDKKLTQPQIHRITEVIRLSVAVDNSEAIIDNNVEILRANQRGFESEFAKLPKSEGEELKKSLQMSIEEQKSGNDPNAPQKL